MVLNATFNNISATLWHFSFIGEGNRSTWRIPPTQGLFGTPNVQVVVNPTTIRSRPRQPQIV